MSQEEERDLLRLGCGNLNLETAMPSLPLKLLPVEGWGPRLEEDMRA